MNKKEIIYLGHGSGGKLSQELIKNIFYKYFDNEILNMQSDSALLDIDEGSLSFTTDSYVVDPIFFPGGNIGNLAVCGTINDLAVSGATPLYLSTSFILEEGFPLNELEIIVSTMASEAKKANVKIVTGDTKVVNSGKCDKIFINTAGIGRLDKNMTHISTGEQISDGDKIIINGTIGDHGIAVMGKREGMNFKSEIKSDAASLHHMIKDTLSTEGIKFMRDATRGGLATVVAELAEKNYKGIEMEEDNIPVKEEVRGLCEIFGFDPLYVANEGKVVIIAHKDHADEIVRLMKKHPEGKDSMIIGEITGNHPGKAVLNTTIGGKRIVDMLAGEQLPRIC